MQKNFVVIRQARTGSTILMTALQNHPKICAYGEVLHNRSVDNLKFVGIDYQNLGIIIAL